MRAAASCAWCNRQLLTLQTREVFGRSFSPGQTWQELGMSLLYDVAHNIAKLEQHSIEGKQKKYGCIVKEQPGPFPLGIPRCQRLTVLSANL
jgi:tRNA-splicing ligase RtcB